MNTILKPMLAVACLDIDKLKYPVYISPKLDGIRCLKISGKAVSRTFKPIANKYIREWIEARIPDGFDGELLAGNNFNEASSAIMSHDGEPDFTYQVFDYVESNCAVPFDARLFNLKCAYDRLSNEVKKRVILVFQHLVEKSEEVTDWEEKFIADGYEGAMIRSVDGPYKNGRSTLREGYLLKLKRFEDAEATIVGFEELLHNENEAEKDAFGRTKRSSCKDGMVPAGTLGKLLLKDYKTGIEFGCGTGFDAALRQQIWDNQGQYVGKLVKYKSQPFGVKEKPRLPVFLGFRHVDDM